MVSYDIYIFIHIFWIPQANVREVYQSLVGRDDGREIQWDFSKRYVYTVCVYFTNCKYVRLGADHYIFRGRGGCTIFLNCCFNFRLRGERNGGNKILHNYYEKVIWYIHFIVV